MSAPDNLHARLLGGACAGAPAVHVRGPGEHRAGAAQRLPAHRRCAADTGTHRHAAPQ